jgi:hypothetical protein
MRLDRHLECGNSVCLRAGSPGRALMIRGASYSSLAAREKQTASWSHKLLTLDVYQMIYTGERHPHTPLHRPAALPPEHCAQLATQCLPPLALVLVCVGAAAAGVLSGAWYRFAVASRRMSSGHALHVCAAGAVASCVPRRCALGQTRSGLAVWVVGPRRSGAAKTAGSAPFLAAAWRRLGGQEGSGEG